MRAKYIAIAFLAVTSILPSSAQTTKIKKGENNYKRFSYLRAIEDYESVDSKSTEVNRKLGESYYSLGNTVKAEEYYAAVVSSPAWNANDLYRYSYILRTNGKYSESEKWLLKYAETNSSDSRAKELLDNAGAIEKLMKDEGRFSITNLDINSEQQDFGTAYCGSKIVFASSREGVKQVQRRWNGNGLPFLDIYIADQTANGQLTNTKNLPRTVNKKYHEGPAAFSEDGKTMIFTRNNYDARSTDGTSNLIMLSAQLVDGKWTNEQPLPFNNKEYSVGQPALSADGNTLYFVSNMPGGIGGTDIYKSTKQPDGKWGSPANLGKVINTEGNEMFPFVHASGILFFASDGHAGLGGLDVFLTQIKGNDFGKLINPGTPLNSSRDDFAYVLDKEMKSGYFSSNRAGGKGNDDIYSFQLLKPFTFGKTIKGIAKDKNDNAIPGALITLTDINGNEIATITSGSDGSFNIAVDEDKELKLSGQKEKYFDGTAAVNSMSDEDVIIADLVLEKDPGISLYGAITEKGSGKALEGVKVKAIDNLTGKIENFTSSASGEMLKALNDKKINDKVSYTFTFEKDGYLNKTITYERVLDKEGKYNMSQEIDLSLDKITVGVDLAKLVNLKPIYFDLGKSAIRKDAAAELDKIVKIMNDNPGMVVELGSHTDCRGTAASNEKLSDSRAKASAEYIKKRIKNPERITGKGYGEMKLKNDCGCEGDVKSTCSESQHQENRRTEFIIIKM